MGRGRVVDVVAYIRLNALCIFHSLGFIPVEFFNRRGLDSWYRFFARMNGKRSEIYTLFHCKTDSDRFEVLIKSSFHIYSSSKGQSAIPG